MNTNPKLIHGLALEWVADQNPTEGTAYLQKRLEVRVYPPNGEGYYFSGQQSPRWLWKDGPDADYFRRAESDEIAEAVESGGMVQATDGKTPFGTWLSWDAFMSEMTGS